jgi:hypothetical protein
METWLPCLNWQKYEVSDLGRVRNAKTGRALSPFPDMYGYLVVNFSDCERRLRVRVNRIVCETFNGLPPTIGHHAAHDDGDKTNNTPNNLVWKTLLDNARDRIRHGTQSSGSEVASKLTADQIRKIRLSSARQVDLAREFGVSLTMMNSICTRRAWADVE